MTRIPAAPAPDHAPLGCPPAGGEGSYGPKCAGCPHGPKGTNVCGGCNGACAYRQAAGCGRKCGGCAWLCANRTVPADGRENSADPASVRLAPWGLDLASWPLLGIAVDGPVHGRPWRGYWVRYSSLKTRHGWRAGRTDFRDLYAMPPGGTVGLSFAVKDDLLEALWRDRAGLDAHLGRFCFDYSLSYNFSSWAQAPRMEVIANRLRTIESVGILQPHVPRVVPHVEGQTAADQREWAHWLADNRPPAVALNTQNHKKDEAGFRRAVAELAATLAAVPGYAPLAVVLGVANPRRAALAAAMLAPLEARFISASQFDNARHYHEFSGGRKRRRTDASRMEVFRLNVAHWYAEYREWGAAMGFNPSSVTLAAASEDERVLSGWSGLPDDGGALAEGAGRRRDVRAAD